MQAGQPLYKYLGAYRDKVPIYGSSLVLGSPEAYAKEALEYKKRGFNAYKLHPPGKYDFDLEAHIAVRNAVGDNFKLMSDPVAPYTFEEALRFGRELEKLNYHWYEEPLYDENFRLVGVLSGGPDVPCGDPGSYDLYGKFDRAWNDVKQWLDPNDTGAMFVDGTYDGSMIIQGVYEWIYDES